MHALPPGDQHALLMFYDLSKQISMITNLGDIIDDSVKSVQDMDRKPRNSLELLGSSMEYNSVCVSMHLK